MNPQTGRRRKVRRARRSIGFGTIIFWGFLGWVWFGDTIKETFQDVTKSVAVVTVNGEKKVIDVDEVLKKVDVVIKDTIEEVDQLIADKKEESKPEPEPDKPKKKEKVMTANDDKFGNSDDLYGDTDTKW